MTGSGDKLVPTQSRMLELQEEHKLLADGQEFLDQKRMLLAGETLRWLRRYDELAARMDAARARGTVALAEAAARHGVAELRARAQAVHGATVVHVSESAFLGVPCTDATGSPAGDELPPTLNPSPEVRRCAAAHRELLALAVETAGVASTLRRLAAEYRRTERRARALEDVLMPEIRAAMKTIGDSLEAYEQEEAIRVRIRKRAP